MNNEPEARNHHSSGVTNPEVGKLLGISYSGVSRIRSGGRYPSLAVMRKVAAAYGWPVGEQAALIPSDGSRNMEYANELERRILGARNDTTTPEQ